jgi:hypothetical protein
MDTNRAFKSWLIEAMTPPERSFAEKADDAARSFPGLYRRDYASPTDFLGSTFRPAIGRRALYGDFTVIECSPSHRVEFMGEELRQDDLTVLLALVKLRQGQLPAPVVIEKPRCFVRDVLGWPDAGTSVQKLIASIERLFIARLRIRNANGTQLVSFVSDAKLPIAGKDGTLEVVLSPRLVDAYKGRLTYLRAEQRDSLKEGLETWLFGIVQSQPCTEPFSLSKLKEAARSTAEQREFNRSLRRALQSLVEVGAVESYEMRKASLRVKRAS